MAVLRVEVPLFDLSDALVEAGWLQGWDADDRQAVEQALNRAVLTMIYDDE